MKHWEKMLAAGLVCATAAVFCQPAEAAYQLNPEVRHATKALKAASEIGVLKHENKELQDLADKDAIVVMTFGTTYRDTRAKTIDATVKAIEAAHPGVKVVTAYTSHIIIDRVAKNEGIKFPTPRRHLMPSRQRDTAAWHSSRSTSSRAWSTTTTSASTTTTRTSSRR